ncbi:MAG: patatin-like phospholipase family protein [Hahellaceae bacterium]|jgi:NTE family protein|nr:patatin-like phospholipase family protein [Hahellaceae bacterium]MCP5209787.1 patatin-like phospholipase family protein [Hahellaceae bacterium]
MKSLNDALKQMAMLFVLLILAPQNGFAEPDHEFLSDAPVSVEPITRPKIGLVLSGGGARGLAHIGVLRVLEEMQIPVDIVVGTSAGSAVAALYAMGLPIDTIEDRFHLMNWERGFVDELSRNSRSFRRKQEDLAYSIDGSLGIDSSGVRLKQSLIQGQQLRLVLQDLLWEANNITSFDDLPRRYRALATDLETGQAVVLAEGQLSEAVRASMTIPAIYPPVKLENRLLVDGGMANNIPISVARELGAEIIIAVDISTPLADREKLGSVIEIVDQLTNFLTRNNADKQIATLSSNDIFIAPELGDVTSSDFSKSDEIVEIGATAARNKAVELHTLALPDAAWNSFLASKLATYVYETKKIKRVRILNGTDINTDVIRQRLRVRRGDEFNRAQLEEDIGVIYGLGYFESVSYQLIDEEDGQTLVIKAEKRSWGPNYLRFSFDYEEDFDIESTINVAALFNMTELNKYGGELSTAFQVGSEPYLLTNFYQPLATKDAQYLTAGARIAKESFNLFVDDELVSQIKINPLEVFFGVGQEIGNDLQIEVSMHREKSNLKAEVGVGAGETERVNHGYGRLSLKFDDLDNSHFPKDGYHVNSNFEVYSTELGSDEDFSLFHFDGLAAYSYRKFVVNVFLRGQYVPDDNAPITRMASLGGFGNLSGYNRDEFVGQDMAVTGIQVYRKMKSSILTYYIGGAYEIGQVWDSAVGEDMNGFKDSASAILAADTFLGPVRFAVSYADSENASVYFTVGKFIN